jgi:hypothetical protein
MDIIYLSHKMRCSGEGHSPIPVVRGKIGKTSSLEINEIDENVIN